MSWNESGGGNKPNDPWGKRPQQNGPPDLDELFRKMSDRVNKAMGGKGGNGAAGPSMGLMAIGLVLAVLVWAFAGVYRVEQAEQAMVLRLGKFHEINTAGLHWNPPLVDRVRKVNTSEINSYSHRASMIARGTKYTNQEAISKNPSQAKEDSVDDFTQEDVNIVDINLEVQYRVSDPVDYFLKINDPVGSLQRATESALRDVVGGSYMDDVITEGRRQVASEVKQKLQRFLDSYQAGLKVYIVNIKDALPPQAVSQAFNDVIKAKEDEARKKNEASTYANRVEPEARGLAKRQEEQAFAYADEVVARAKGEANRFEKLLSEYKKAPEVTRSRLYIETMEEVYGSTAKVFLDSEGNQGLFYLPLDQLLKSRQSMNNAGENAPRLIDFDRRTMPQQSSSSDRSSSRSDSRVGRRSERSS